MTCCCYSVVEVPPASSALFLPSKLLLPSVASTASQSLLTSSKPIFGPTSSTSQPSADLASKVTFARQPVFGSSAPFMGKQVFGAGGSVSSQSMFGNPVSQSQSLSGTESSATSQPLFGSATKSVSFGDVVKSNWTVKSTAETPDTGSMFGNVTESVGFGDLLASGSSAAFEKKSGKFELFLLQSFVPGGVLFASGIAVHFVGLLLAVLMPFAVLTWFCIVIRSHEF